MQNSYAVSKNKAGLNGEGMSLCVRKPNCCLVNTIEKI